MDRNIDHLLQRFDAEYLTLNSISQDRRDQSAWVLRRLADSTARGIEHVTPSELAAFVGADIARGVKPTTALKYLNMIRTFVRWAGTAGVIDPQLAAELKLIANPRGSAAVFRPKPYTVKEIREFYAELAVKYPTLPQSGKGSRAMIKFCKGSHTRLRGALWVHARRLQFEAMIALALEEGLRSHEILKLSIPALHPDNDHLVVLTAKQAPGVEIKRSIPYTTHARTCVQEWLDLRKLVRPAHEEPWLALYRTGPLSVQTQPLQEIAEMLGVFPGGWAWHRFRHTCATEWLRSHVPLEKVRVYMGHSDIAQTLAYAELLNSDVDEAFASAEADFARRLGLAA